MRNKWRLRLNSEPLIIIPGPDLYPAEAETIDPWQLAAHLPKWLADPLDRQVIVSIYEHLHGRTALNLKDSNPGMLLRRAQPRVEAAFRQRELVALYLVAPNLAQSLKEEAPPTQKGAAPPERRGKQKTWIEIELVDSRGRPVRYERYRIELPDGTFTDGVTDARGLARVTDFEPGECQICFPDRDAREWRGIA